MGARRTTGWIAASALVALVAASATAGAVAAAPGRVTPAVTTSPAKGELGSWRVQAVGAGRYEVSWTSPTRLPMTSDRPTIVGPDDIAVSSPTIAPDGRTVRALVTAPARPDPAELDVLLSGDRLDVPGQDRLRVGGGGTPQAALDLPGTRTLAEDPGTPGPYAVVTSDYQLAPVKVDGLPQPVEMVGHVVEPAPDAATGPRPLVLFLHGRHGVCYDPADSGAEGDWPCRAPFKEIPSQLGYDYIQQVLASQGYATVSVRVNGINAQDYRLEDGGADARAQIVERHLDYWAGQAAAHDVDLSRVVLVGHSRGGEGVDRASIQIPLSAPYRIVGQVLIAPTDFATQTAPYVPTVTLLPFCDGDVSDLQGQRFTDSGRDLTSDDTSLKSTVLVMGADHNFFNTEWTPGLSAAPSDDDWYDTSAAPCGSKNPDRLSPQQQQAVGTAYVSGAVHLFADDDQALLPLFDGSRARVASQGTAQTLSAAIGGGRVLRTPGLSTSLSLAEGADTRFCRGDQASDKVGSCTFHVGYGQVMPHWPGSYERVPTRPFFQMSWTAAGQSGGMDLTRPLDLTGRRLDLRTIVDPRSTDVDLRVRITDADGHSAVLTPVGGGTLPALGGSSEVEKFWAQTLEVDPATATGVDLGRVVAVDLVSASDRGRVWVADLAATPSTLAAVPDERLPTVDIGQVRVDEGNGSAPAVARVPFTVHGTLDRPARMIVVTTGQARGDVQRFTVNLAAGQTGGTIPISYTPNRRDDFDEALTQVSAWPTRNVMTDDYLGSATVVDDDPTPAITIRAVKRTVKEGQPARWRVHLAKAVDYDLSITGKVVRGPRPAVRVSDIGQKWLDLHVGPVDTDKPLWAYGPMTYDQLRQGGRSLDISIPTVRDRLDEPRESLTLRIDVNGKRVTRTVRVVGDGSR